MGMPRLPSCPKSGVLLTLVLILNSSSSSSCLSSSSYSHLILLVSSLSHLQPTHPSLPLALTYSQLSQITVAIIPQTPQTRRQTPQTPQTRRQTPEIKRPLLL